MQQSHIFSLKIFLVAVVGWSVYCGDANLRLYQTGFAMRDAGDSSSYSGYEKDFMKQTMLEHEAVFKNQVFTTLLMLAYITQNSSIYVATRF